MHITTRDQNLTMSSREIAQLTNSRHDSVKRSMERMASSLVISITPTVEPTAGGGKPITIYHVTKRDSYVVVAQLSPEFTARLVDRWQELEEANQLHLPKTFSEALQLASDQARQLELAAPKVKFVENLVERKSLMNATQIAQQFGKSAVWLNKQLEDLDVYNKSVKRGRTFQKWFVDNGLGEMKQTEVGYPQALFSPAGEIWIYQKFISEGIL
ncbi:Rha family transcriptional regulator [Vibrio fluvialis]